MLREAAFGSLARTHYASCCGHFAAHASKRPERMRAHTFSFTNTCFACRRVNEPSSWENFPGHSQAEKAGWTDGCWHLNVLYFVFARLIGKNIYVARDRSILYRLGQRDRCGILMRKTEFACWGKFGSQLESQAKSAASFIFHIFIRTQWQKRELSIDRSSSTMEKHQNHGFHVKSFDSRALKKSEWCVPLSIQKPSMLSTPFKESRTYP